MTLVRLDPDDLHFIVTYDPDRERAASRRDLVAVIEEIQALVCEGVIVEAEETETHVIPPGRDDHFRGWDCYCVPGWMDADGTRTYRHHDVSYWAARR
jgi:hypothetical protein